MTLTVQFYVVFKSLYIYGVFPFKLNKLTNNFYCANHYIFYSAVFFFITSFTASYVFLIEILDKGLSKYFFENTLSTLSFIIDCVTVIIYSVHMFDLILHRCSQVKFLNKMLRVDEKIIESCMQNCYNFPKVQQVNLAWQHLFVSVFLIFTNIPVLVLNLSRLTTLNLLWSFSVWIQIVTSFQIPIYIRNCAFILNQNFSRLYLLVNKLMEVNTPDWHTILRCFELFEDLEQLKKLFSDTFGVHILIIYLYDFVILTITLYYLMYQLISEFNWFSIYLIVSTCFLNMIKCILLTSTLDKLGDQVNEMKKYASKVSITGDKPLEASIDLFFLKLQHMEKRKYVTANDFFPINYAMLYNMGAAIITHMMIILQFQLWEETQKLVNSTFDNDTFA